MITQEQLKQVLSYDESTGIFTWLSSHSRNARTGGTAGSKSDKCGGGYVSIRVCGYYCGAHRLAWLYVYGKWPSGEIDHINGNKRDNRISNLRDVTRRVNRENQRGGRHSKNVGAPLGAFPYRTGWKSKIVVRGKQHHLGYFATSEEAHAAYVNAKRQLHEGCSI